MRKKLTQIEPPEFLFWPEKQRSYPSNAALHAGPRRSESSTSTRTSRRRPATGFIDQEGAGSADWWQEQQGKGGLHCRTLRRFHLT
jgi:hypothetical protein